jgi:hypothetical protein
MIGQPNTQQQPTEQWVTESITIEFQRGEIKEFTAEEHGAHTAEVFPADMVRVFTDKGTFTYHWDDISSFEVRGSMVPIAQESEKEKVVSLVPETTSTDGEVH